MDKVSYALGIGIGHQLANMGGQELNIDDFAQAVKDVLGGKELKIKSSEAQMIVQEFFAAQEQKINKQREEAGKMAKEAGEKYLAENAKKDGIITLPSGLQYQVLKEGNGKKPSAKDSVKCHYEAWRTRRLWTAAGYCWLDGRSAADAGGCEVSFLHPLSLGIRRGWCRRFYSSLCCSHLRRGAHPGDVMKMKD